MGVSIIVAIDGPAGAGKSTVARLVAQRLGVPYLDTGALYRAIAFFLDSRNIPPVENTVLTDALSTLSIEFSDRGLLLNGEEAGSRIRSPHVDSIVSQYSALPMVRRRLLSIQRDQGKKGLVADGRDMGTVVFPDATVKIFLTASDAVRARRRYLELRARGENVAFDDVLDVIRRRDRIDAERTSAPLKKADDAVEINTDGLTAEEAAREILMHIERRAAEREAHQ